MSIWRCWKQLFGIYRCFRQELGVSGGRGGFGGVGGKLLVFGGALCKHRVCRGSCCIVVGIWMC